MKIFCFDCTKYAAHDDVSKFLAFCCQTSYLLPFWMIAVTYVRRRMDDILILIGCLVNIGFSIFLKKAWQQARPETCAALGICDSFGMPSTHSQVAAYFFGAHCVMLMTFDLIRQADVFVPAAQADTTARTPDSSLEIQYGFRMFRQIAENVVLLALMLAVGFARVYLGYHTHAQVVVGLLLGLAFGSAWTFASRKFCVYLSKKSTLVRYLRMVDIDANLSPTASAHTPFQVGKYFLLSPIREKDS